MYDIIGTWRQAEAVAWIDCVATAGSLVDFSNCESALIQEALLK